METYLGYQHPTILSTLLYLLKAESTALLLFAEQGRPSPADSHQNVLPNESARPTQYGSFFKLRAGLDKPVLAV